MTETSGPGGWADAPGELAAFLEEPNLARIGTIDPDGAVHVVPTWFHWDGRVVLIGSDAGSHKVANVRRTGRASVTIDGDVRRKRGVLLRGTATVIDGDAGRARYAAIAEAQVRRYQPDKPPHETAQRMASRGEPVVIVVEPVSRTAWGR